METNQPSETALAPQEVNILRRIARFGEAPRGQFKKLEWDIVEQLAERGICRIGQHGSRIYASNL